MDDELGPVVYFDEEKMQWLPFKKFSEKTNEIIDEKVKNILKTAYEKAKKILKENADTIHKLAKILLEKEYLTREEFESIMKNPKKADQILKQIEEEKKKKKEKFEKKAEKQKDNQKEENPNKEKVKQIWEIIEKLKGHKKDNKDSKK
jgi:cell division protease FtsH